MSNPEQHVLGDAGPVRDRYAGFDHAASVWNRAAAADAQGDPFCCRTEWQLSFHETFSPRRVLRLLEAGGSVAAFAERFDPQLGLLLEPVESSWLFGCPLLGEGALDLLDELLGDRRYGAGSPRLLIGGLLRDHDLRRRVEIALSSRYTIRGLESTVLCTASLAGGFDGYLSRRSGKLRRSLRRITRHAQDSGLGYQRCAPRSAAAAAAIYARMLAVERASWKGLGRCGMAESPSREFYATMLRRLADSGTGRVIFARCDERDVGFIFGGLAGRTYRGQQFSYVEDFRLSSIGSLLQAEQIRWLCEEGVERYDMGPMMDYKRHWTEDRSRIEALLLEPCAR